MNQQATLGELLRAAIDRQAVIEKPKLSSVVLVLTPGTDDVIMEVMSDGSMKEYKGRATRHIARIISNAYSAREVPKVSCVALARWAMRGDNGEPMRLFAAKQLVDFLCKRELNDDDPIFNFAGDAKMFVIHNAKES